MTTIYIANPKLSCLHRFAASHEDINVFALQRPREEWLGEPLYEPVKMVPCDYESLVIYNREYETIFDLPDTRHKLEGTYETPICEAYGRTSAFIVQVCQKRNMCIYTQCPAYGKNTSSEQN